jgi:hypothetical protein
MPEDRAERWLCPAPGTTHVPESSWGVLVSLRRFSRCRAATSSSLAIAASLIVVIMMAGQASGRDTSPIPEPTTPAPQRRSDREHLSHAVRREHDCIAAEAASSLSCPSNRRAVRSLATSSKTSVPTPSPAMPPTSDDGTAIQILPPHRGLKLDTAGDNPAEW